MFLTSFIKAILIAKGLTRSLDAANRNERQSTSLEIHADWRGGARAWGSRGCRGAGHGFAAGECFPGESMSSFL
jgi:hypothetical protein